MHWSEVKVHQSRLSGHLIDMLVSASYKLLQIFVQIKVKIPSMQISVQDAKVKQSTAEWNEIHHSAAKEGVHFQITPE